MSLVINRSLNTLKNIGFGRTRNIVLESGNSGTSPVVKENFKKVQEEHARANLEPKQAKCC